MKRLVPVSLACLLLSACASRLEVWNAAQAPVKGVPFRATELYRQTGVYKKHSEHGEACTPSPFERVVTLPTGAQYFANVAPAALSKSEFSMTFADSGSLSTISMNTEPAGADTINAAAGALSTLLPFVGVTAKPVAAAAAPPAPPGPAPVSTLPACDAGPESVRYDKF